MKATDQTPAFLRARLEAQFRAFATDEDDNPTDGTLTVADALEVVKVVFDTAPAQPSPLVTSDNEPPVPLPTTLPRGTVRVLNGMREESPAGLVLMWNAFGEPRYEGFPHPALTRPEDIDWSHYRAQQRAAEPTPEAAWNYSAELRCLEERISKLEAKVGA